MTQSPVKGPTYIEALARHSGLPQDDVRTYFNKFSLDDDSPFFYSLVDSASIAFESNVSNTCLGRLKIFRHANEQFTRFRTRVPHDRVIPDKEDHELVQVILGLNGFITSSAPDTAQEAYTILLVVIILAVLSSEDQNRDNSLIKNASMALRRSGPDSRDKGYHALCRLGGKLSEEVGGISSLTEAIDELAMDNKHPLFRNFQKLIRHIDRATTKQSQSKHRVPVEIEVLYTDDEHSQKLTYINQRSESEYEEEQGVYVEIREATISSLTGFDETSKEHLRRQGIESANLDLLEKKIKNESSSFAKHYQYHSRPVIRSCNYLVTSTAIYSVTEREVLRRSLEVPEDYGSNSLSALVTGLAICTFRTARLALELRIGKDGDISPDGYFMRSFPELRNAIKPKYKGEYVSHINDQDDCRIKLKLPDFVSQHIKNCFIDSRNENRCLKDLLVTQSKETPTEISNIHIQQLNKIYGDRFIGQRVGNQLKAYIETTYNDPCLVFALTSSAGTRPPSAMYYRAMPSSEIKKEYQKSIQRYFRC